MAKTRITISLDPEHADTIRAAAEEYGQDLSAFVTAAALAEAGRAARVRAAFADIDARIAEAESAAGGLADERDPLPEAEAEAIRERIRSRRAGTTGARGKAA